MTVADAYPDSAKILNRRAGYTLIEVIAVLLIIGITATVAISRLPSIDSYSKKVETDTLKSHLRYAQNKAMNTNFTWGIHFLSSSEYRLYSKEAGTLYRYFPTLESAGTVSLSVLEMQPGTIVKFDDVGSPGLSDISVKTQDSAELFSVTGETGFIR